jgi:hypothetical protein
LQRELPAVHRSHATWRAEKCAFRAIAAYTFFVPLTNLLYSRSKHSCMDGYTGI